jgi:hypothetical protein
VARELIGLVDEEITSHPVVCLRACRAHRHQDRGANTEPRAEVLHQGRYRTHFSPKFSDLCHEKKTKGLCYLTDWKSKSSPPIGHGSRADDASLTLLTSRRSRCSALQVIRESSGSESASGAAAPAIQIPPPRPKRKPAHPYPRKVDDAAKKHALMLKQLEKPPAPRMQSLREQDDWSPTSVLTAAQTALRADALDGGVFSITSSGDGRSRVPSVAGSDDHGNGGGSSVDREEYGCLSPSIAAAELAVKPPNTKVYFQEKILFDSYATGLFFPFRRQLGNRHNRF